MPQMFPHFAWEVSVALSVRRTLSESSCPRIIVSPHYRVPALSCPRIIQDFASRTDSDLGYLAAIRAGVGVGVCHLAPGRRDPNPVHLLPDVFAFDLETWIVMHEDQRSVHRIRLAFDHLAQALSAYATP